MDNLALSVTKSITDFLEHNEKRLASQNSQLDRQNQLLIELQTKFEKLEKKCGELESENTGLRSEIQLLKQADESSSKNMIALQADLEKMQDQAKKYGDWVNVMGVLTQQVHDLNLIRDETKETINNLLINQSKLDKKIERQQRQINTVSATARAASVSAAAAAAPSPITNAPHYNVINRTAVRSPSTSSFFNGNNNSHNQMHRFKPQMSSNTHNHFNHYSNDDYLGSTDPFDEVSELSENAEELVREVKALNELQRSFEKGSICSD